MRPLTEAKRNNVISLLTSGHSIPQITVATGVGHGTVSRICSQYCSNLPKSTGGRPSKLKATNVNHAIRLITSHQVETAVEVTRTLRNITNQPLSTETVHQQLKAANMTAVSKRKKPFLKKHHKKACLDFALAHKDWTMDDWKRVVWSDETKINRLGSYGKKWAWKKKGEGLSD